MAGTAGGTAPGAPASWPVQAAPISGFAQPMPNTQTRPNDHAALQEAKTGALIGIIGLLLSVIGSYLAFTYGVLGVGVTANCSDGTCTYPSASAAVTGAVIGLDIVGYIIAVLFILRFRSAFQKLVPIDFRFRSPANLAILAVVGIIILVLAEILLGLGAINVINACRTGSYTSCDNAVTNNLGLILGGAGLAVLGAILLLIGGILVLVGIWRMGTRYDNSMLKIGAILLIFPFLDIVGVILIYIGAGQSLQVLNQSGVGGMGGMGAAPLAFTPPPGAH